MLGHAVVITALSVAVDVRIMRYEDDKTSASRAGRTAAGRWTPFYALSTSTFARSEATHALERYLSGLLTEHPNKNCDTLAQVVPHTSEQSLLGLLTAMRRDQDDLNKQSVQALLALPPPRATLPRSSTTPASLSRASLRCRCRKRQYSGTLGKVGNCQVAVNGHYAERTLAWPVATRLYLG